MAIIPKASWGARVTVVYTKLNQTPSARRLSIPRADQHLGSLGTGRILIFDAVSSYDQITAYKYTIPRTSFYIPTGLYEWLVVPQGVVRRPAGSSVDQRNHHRLAQVAAYLDDVIVIDSDPTATSGRYEPFSSACANTASNACLRETARLYDRRGRSRRIC